MKKMCFLLVILCISLQSLYSVEFDKSKLPKLLGTSNMGREFYFNFLPAWEVSGDAYMIYITSEVRTKVTVEIPAKGYIQTKYTEPNEIIEFTLGPAIGACYSRRPFSPPPQEQVYKGAGIHVIADDPVLCYAVTRFLYTSDGFLALPVNKLGQEYIVASSPDAADNISQWLTSYTSITAAYDKTNVTFQLGGNEWTKTTGGLKPSKWSKWNLNAGDVLLIASLGSKADLSGSKITATAPVAVVSGNYCAYIPTNCSCCDVITEMELPLNTWGTTYHVTPIANRQKNSMIKIFAKEANTKIFKDYQQIGFLNSSGGVEGVGYLSMRADEGNPRPIVISGNKPIGVTQYNTGQLDDGITSDPFQMVLVPTEQYQKGFTFNPPGIGIKGGFTNNYLNICYPSDTTGNLPDDLYIGEYDKNLKDFTWTELKNSTGLIGIPFVRNDSIQQYGFARYKILQNSVYKIASAKPIQAYLYGFTDFESYGYPASVSLKDLTIKDSFPPVPYFNMDNYGRVNSPFGSKFVVDKPDNPMFRSNINSIEIINALTYNYKLLHEGFVPCEEFSIAWGLEIIDFHNDAQAVLSFTDCAGNICDTVIFYNAPDIKIVEDNYNFGLVASEIEQWKKFSIVNRGTTNENIYNIFLLQKDSLKNPQGFTIWNENKEETFQYPYSLEAGDTLKFWVKFVSNIEGHYWDSIGVQLCCIPIFKSLVKAEVKAPVMSILAWRFPPTIVNSSAYGQCDIINEGQVDLKIYKMEGPFIKSKYNNSTIYYSSELELRDISENNVLTIPRGSLITFNVSFSPEDTIIYQDSIVFFSNTNKFKPQADSILYFNARGIVSTQVSDDNESLFLLFPNPTEDILIIDKLPMNTSKIQIFDETGKEVRSIEIKSQTESLKISTKEFTSGYYLIRINTDRDNFVKKFIIRK